MHTEINSKNLEQNDAGKLRQFDAREQETAKPEKTESLEKLTNEYIKDIKEKSEFPDTIPDKPFETSDLRPVSVEEKTAKDAEYDKCRNKMIKEWEDLHGREWPRYQYDIKDANGNIIRHKGDRYDCHHIQPLSMGGKNEVSNITPLSADVHFDHQGVHSSDSPYSKIQSQLKQGA